MLLGFGRGKRGAAIFTLHYYPAGLSLAFAESRRGSGNLGEGSHTDTGQGSVEERGQGL